jgi:hypothetical protein
MRNGFFILLSNSLASTRVNDCPSTINLNNFQLLLQPLLETYQSRTVKSLALCCIELATGNPVVIAQDGRMKFGVNELRVDSRNCVTAKLPVKDDLAYIPFHQFLAGEISASRIKGKIVIIGYDGSQIHSISTAIGPVRAHRFFVYVLQSIYEQVGI